MNLEQKLAKLDELAQSIEQENITLSKSLEIFEQSVTLAKECMQTLNDCKGHLVVLTEEVRRIVDEK